MAIGKKTGGRTKGTVNKRTFDAQKLAEEKGCDPLEILIDIAKGDWEALGYEKDHVIKFSMGNPFAESVITMDHRVSAAKEAAKYIYPQLKAIELTGKDGKNLFAEKLLKAQSRAEKTIVGGATVEGEGEN